MEIKLDLGTILVAYAVLFFFGLIYNRIIAWLDEKRYLEGFTSLAVAFGVAITVIAMAAVSPFFSLLMLGAFVMSGAPMIGGGIYRYVRARAEEQAELRRTLKL